MAPRSLRTPRSAVAGKSFSVGSQVEVYGVGNSCASGAGAFHAEARPGCSRGGADRNFVPYPLSACGAVRQNQMGNAHHAVATWCSDVALECRRRLRSVAKLVMEDMGHPTQVVTVADESDKKGIVPVGTATIGTVYMNP